MIRFLQRKKLVIMLSIVVMGIGLSLFAVTMTYKPKQAEAYCCSGCFCVLETFLTDFMAWIQTWFEINLHIWLNLGFHRLFWFDFTYWQQHMLPAFMQAGSQYAAVGMKQMAIIGMFMDAQQQVKTQRLIQEMRAQAHKDYHPSVGMCEFGTRVKGLAASERKGEMNALILSERSLDRFFSNKDTATAKGGKADMQARLDKFKFAFCDTNDHNSGLYLICPHINDSINSLNPITVGGVTISAAERRAIARQRFNKDIDYQRTIEHPLTIPFDLTNDASPSDSDEEIIAMADNLYGYTAFNNADHEKIATVTNTETNALQKAYLDMRAVVAKTNVAQNSFNALLALKGEGTEGSSEFIQAYLQELGVPEEETQQFLGENPSYHAQMEILTKKAYQSPLFYTNLYDKPANVERKAVAMQAIGLIQKFDLLKSYLRTEASLSVLLELSIQQLQNEIENVINTIDTGKGGL